MQLLKLEGGCVEGKVGSRGKGGKSTRCSTMCFRHKQHNLNLFIAWLFLLLLASFCPFLLPPFPAWLPSSSSSSSQPNGFSWVARCESRPHVAIWIFVYVKWKFMAHTLITDWWIRECRCCCEANTLLTSFYLPPTSLTRTYWLAARVARAAAMFMPRALPKISSSWLPPSIVALQLPYLLILHSQSHRSLSVRLV